jgi:hypothetical protein
LRKFAYKLKGASHQEGVSDFFPVLKRKKARSLGRKYGFEAVE